MYINPNGTIYDSPRWILGFIYIANTIHLEIFSFDPELEEREFYRKFYGITSGGIVQNRDFSRPSVG